MHGGAPLEELKLLTVMKAGYEGRPAHHIFIFSTPTHLFFASGSVSQLPRALQAIKGNKVAVCCVWVI
jgi:hypothetical protein